MEQYDEYYVVTDEIIGLKVFSQKEKIVALVKVEETMFDKIKVDYHYFLQIDLQRKNICQILKNRV